MITPLTALLLLSTACSGDPDPTKPATCERWYIDADADGYGDPGLPISVCGPGDEAGAVPNNLDCDDADPAVNPQGEELCDPWDRDEDCDGQADDADDDAVGGVDTWPDGDGDGLGDPDGQVEIFCDVPSDRSPLPGDCDDTDPATFLGAAQESPSACMTDSDGDGFGDATPTAGVTPGTDCDDSDD
ncbi:MAG TPA: hypothetical protein ENK18_00680, partial [Deltaproteobacteria bacterium]|nr:hypothetical protein [Deltaproteobacteria bacterium]